MNETFNAEDFAESDDQRAGDTKRSRRTLWLCLTAVLAPLLIAALAVGGYLWTLRDAYVKDVTFVDVTRTASDGDAPAEGAGTNILLLGSDKRDPEAQAAEGVFGQRSDVMMLVHISADGQYAYVSSFPRDLYVEIPGHGQDRINAALAFGGVPLAVATVENYVGTEIDHVALVDFDGIEAIVDALGGIDVEIPETFEGDGVQFTEGIQHLNGAETLTFVRQRYQFAGGDFQRNANQRAVMKAIAQKIISGGTLLDPGKIVTLTGEISPHLTVDSALTPEKIVELGLASRDLRPSTIRYLSVPHGDPFMTSGGASVVGTDEEAMDAFREAIREDTMEDYVSSTG
ncbi:MAG: LCP family protein [Dermabacter sp.]|nr:LCP family protein [Dermabacter sp.]